MPISLGVTMEPETMQGAPEASVPLVGEPKTAENDAEFDIGEIWPVLHLSNRTPFV